MTQNTEIKISSSTEPFTLTDWDKKAFSVIPATKMHPDSIRLNWLIERLKTSSPYNHVSIQFPNAELVQFTHTHLTTSDSCPIEECEVWGEAAYPDFRQAIDNAMAHFEKLCQQEMEQPKMSMIEQLKQKYPKCCNILSLVQHLHRDCADPENAAYATLEWLAGIIQNDKPIHTHLCFADGAGTGKSLFINDVLRPIFGHQATEMPAESEKFNARLNIVNISNTCDTETMLAAYRKLTFAKMSNHPRIALLFYTNQMIELDPANRRFRIARRSTRLDDGLYKAVTSEITNGGLMQFADLLHTIYGSTDELRNLNAIY